MTTWQDTTTKSLDNLHQYDELELDVLGIRIAVAVVLLAALAACSTGIKVTRLVGDGAVQGNPWNLAMTQFTVTITRHVIECGDSLIGTVEIIATPSAVLDEEQRYVLESNGWWATSDITSNLAANGTSTGLNASSVDATTTIISNVVGTIGQGVIAAAAAAPLAAAPLAAAPPAPATNVCNKKLAIAVSKLYPNSGSSKKGLTALVDEKVAALAEMTAKVALLTAQGSLDKTYKKALITALDDQSALQKSLAADQQNLSAALKATTDTQVFRWPLRSIDFRADTAYSLDAATLNKWLDSNEKQVAKAKPQFDVYLALYRPNSKDAKWIAPKAAPFSGADVGVPVRLAQTGRLLACAKCPCPPEFPIVGSTDLDHTQFDQVVLQLGQLYTVPLTGGSFRSQTAVVALDANGLPTTIQVSEKAAAGVGLSGALKDTVTQIGALPAQVAAAKLAATTSQTNQLNAQAALATAQANAGVAGQTAPLVAQTALINAQNALAVAQANAGAQQTLEISAQTAMLNAQAALVTAQANAITGSAIGALNAQTSLINAQTAQINAAAALAKARIAVP